MDSDVGKLFLGGISWETTEDKIREHFRRYGEVADTVVMRDRVTGRSRGFGFVVFADPSVADTALLDKHTIDGRTIEVKKALPRDEQQNAMKNNSPSGGSKTKKIFVGGLASNVTEEDFRAYFQQFGSITDVVVMYDPNTQRPRGFGFITFDSEDAVDRVLEKTFHDLKGKMVEVKRAVPKELSMGGGRGGSGAGRGSGYGGPYGQGYNTSPSASGYTARPDNRLGAGSAGRGGYPYAAPAYGTNPYTGAGAYPTGVNGGGYGAPSYAATSPYGAAAAGAAYAGGYGVAPGGPGYVAGGGYGAPAAGGYGAVGRGPWGGAGAVYPTMQAAGYVTGAAPYGAPGGWGSTLQSPGNSGGYGGGGYGYGGTEGAYTSTASGYPAKSGFTGSGTGGYGDVYGNAGYADGAAAGGTSTGTGTGYSGGDGGTDGAANVTGSGYGAAGRQMQRGPDTRFRPYPITNERAS